MKRAALSIVLVLLAGCALDPIPEDKIKTNREYQTGSNLPRKEPRSTDVTTLSKEQAEEALRRNAPSPGPRGGS